MAESEISSLKEALHNQHITTTRLYIELEEERKASGSAADEALSMISRLQEEKAAGKLEASQYKRMAEEKLQYAEQSLAFLKDILHQKDLEIEVLKYQVLAYRHRLYNNGFESPHLETMETYDSLPLKRSRAFPDKRRLNSIARRNISLPAIQLEKLCSEMDIVDEENPFILREGYEENYLSKSCTLEECHSDLDQAEEVRLKVKELMQAMSTKERTRSTSSSADNELWKTAKDDALGLPDSRSCSCCKAVHGLEFCESVVVKGRGANGEGAQSLPSHAQNLEDKLKCCALGSSCLETESINIKTTNSTSFEDVFEVTESLDTFSISELCNQMLLEPNLKNKNLSDVHISLSQEAAESSLRDDVLSQNSSSAHHGNCMIGSHPSQIEIEQLKERLQQLEDDREIMKEEDSERGKEQLTLLREIREQLETIQSHVKNLKFKKSPPKENPLFVSLVEAMLHFSI